MPRVRFVVSVFLVSVAGIGAASAEEWYEAYRRGLQALARGQASQAVRPLEFAAAQRPEPGRNVVTYGTNVEPRYYPYLHLAEAYLQLRDLAGARAALKRSETWGREPADERRALAARVEELASRLAGPAAGAASVAPPAAPTTEPARTAAATPAPAPATPAPAAPASVTMPPPTPAPRATPPAASPAVSGAPVPTAATSAAPAVPGLTGKRSSPGPSTVSSSLPGPTDVPLPPAAATLEVVSQPPGASVYLDDELIGVTDPEWGRLVRSGIPTGRHRVRLTLAGHEDMSEDLELAAGRTDFRRRLSAASAPIDRRLVLGGAVVVVLLGLTAWALRRSGAAEGSARGTAPGPVAVSSVGRATPPPARVDPHPARATPPGMGSPGARRDAAGHEYFGDYRLIEPLGRGGMASVYKAERGGEVCALKRPLAAFLVEPEFLERFLREAEIGRTLHHPNIVRILERGEVEGVPFFTMELVPGETLQSLLLRQGALDPRAATRTIVQMAEALDYAHSKGVIHRDLKPSNVMVLSDGTTKVMDFGIARARRFEGLTVTGSFLGSPEYVAPEAIEGKVTDVRSDLYSLGVIFYEVLTGRRPFSADTPFALLRKHLTEVPVPPTRLRPEVPPDIERIVLRLLQKAVEERYTAAEDLVLELRDFLNRAA